MDQQEYLVNEDDEVVDQLTFVQVNLQNGLGETVNTFHHPPVEKHFVNEVVCLRNQAADFRVNGVSVYVVPKRTDGLQRQQKTHRRNHKECEVFFVRSCLVSDFDLLHQFVQKLVHMPSFFVGVQTVVHFFEHVLYQSVLANVRQDA